MITRRTLVTGALHRKQQESSSKTGAVLSPVPSTQSNYGKWLQEIMQKSVRKLSTYPFHAQKMPNNQWQLQHSSL